MLQSLLIIVSGWSFTEGTNLARSGSSSELSLRANISRKRKSCGLTEYQFLRVNHFVILSLPKIPHLRRTPARSLQTVCSSLTPACLSSHLLARSSSSSPPPPASTCVETYSSGNQEYFQESTSSTTARRTGGTMGGPCGADNNWGVGAPGVFGIPGAPGPPRAISFWRVAISCSGGKVLISGGRVASSCRGELLLALI